MLASALLCMALNVYHESRGEPIRGQEAVAHVTLNRAESGRYPGDVCSVVMQRHQFEWVHSKIYDIQWEDGRVVSFKVRHWGYPREEYAWDRAISIASEVLTREQGDFTGGAIFFRTRNYGRYGQMHLATIGNHSFYR